MQYKVFGKQNRDVIVLLHGGGLSWWNYREISELLQNDLQIIIPILDGHTGSDKDFTSIEDNATLYCSITSGEKLVIPAIFCCCINKARA